MPPLASSYYLERIRNAFPDLMWANYRRVQTIADPDHVMILLDNGIAFRFENDEETNLTRERTVLDALRSNLKAIPIPDYAFVPKASDFAGYHTIPGTRLSPWRFWRLSKENRSEAAQRLGVFISELHSYPVAKARSLGVEEGDASVSAAGCGRSYSLNGLTSFNVRSAMFSKHGSKEVKASIIHTSLCWLTMTSGTNTSIMTPRSEDLLGS